MLTYNLSICCVNGSIYGLISSDKRELQGFLKKYDHEGSTLNLVRHEGDDFASVAYDQIYSELGL